MLQPQSVPDNTNVVNNDKKTTDGTAVSVVTNARSINTVDQEQQLNSTRNDRLKKNVARLSNRRTLFQAALTIPSFVVELQYGIKYINQCPIQPLINVFLIVHACSSLVNGIVLVIGHITANYILKFPSPPPHARCLLAGSSIGELILLIFSIAWLIVGQVWVFGAQSNGFQSSNSTISATYCNSNVFWTGFAIIIVTYGIWLILILVFVGLFLKKRHKAKQETVPKTDEHG